VVGSGEDAFDRRVLPRPTRWRFGVLTATFGGVIRDVLAGEPSVILRRRALHHLRPLPGR
jgi:uncharacterized membrane protein YeiH